MISKNQELEGVVISIGSNGEGVVKADGKSWSARSADGSIIPAGSVVEVQKIDGVKLIVGLIQNK